MRARIVVFLIVIQSILLFAHWFIYTTWKSFRAIADPPGFTPVKSGEKQVATAKFSEPGTYELRAIAHDSILQTTKNVTIVVK